MLEFGMVAEAALGLAALLWYGRAAGPFSERIVGYDLRRRPADMRTSWRDGPAANGRRVLAAWGVPSSDPETEHWRVLMRRRFAIFVLVVCTFFVLPAMFAVIGLDWSVLSRGGLTGIVPLGFLVAILALAFIEVARPLVAYGSGAPLDLRKVSLAVARLAVALGVAIAVAVIGAS